MSAKAILKKFQALYLAIEADPELTLLGCMHYGKMPGAKVDKELAKAGVEVTAETRAYLMAMPGIGLSWVRGKFPTKDEAKAAFVTGIAEGRCKLGATAGLIKMEPVVEVLLSPRTAIPEASGWKRLDPYDHDQFHVVGLNAQPGGHLVVRMGDDYGADFESGNPITLGGYLEMMVAGAGLGRPDLLLKFATRGARPVLDAAGWFDEFDAALTLRLIKGEAEAVAKWKAIAERVPKA